MFAKLHETLCCKGELKSGRTSGRVSVRLHERPNMVWPATFPAESLDRDPKGFRLSVPLKMFDEYLLRLGRETVGDVDRVRRSVKGARADPLIDRLSELSKKDRPET